MFNGVIEHDLNINQTASTTCLHNEVFTAQNEWIVLRMYDVCTYYDCIHFTYVYYKIRHFLIAIRSNKGVNMCHFRFLHCLIRSEGLLKPHKYNHTWWWWFYRTRYRAWKDTSVNLFNSGICDMAKYTVSPIVTK